MKSAPAVLVLMLAGCAYFNGVYNARVAEGRGDRLTRHGDVAGARAQYVEAAQEAEAVLVHHPGSRWAMEARFVAGRAWAMADECERAIPHLEQWLSSASPFAARRHTAALAFGRCLVVERRLVDALQLLHPLTASVDDAVAGEASLWSARAALGLGDYDLARTYLRHAGESTAEWELALAYVDHQRLVDAVPLLRSRAEAGDGREELFDILPRLWRAGHGSAVQQLVHVYDGTEQAPTRARLHLMLGELLLADGDDSGAFTHLSSARALSRDGATAEIASARLTLLSLRELPTLLDVVNAVGRSLPPSGGSVEHRRLWSSVVLTSMLLRHVDHSGAALFLAGEVARDSLRAYALARTLFLRVSDQYPRSPVAPKALMAAAIMYPDAPWYRARLLADYPESAFAAITRGEEPRSRADLERADRFLSSSWSIIARLHADSMARVGTSELAAEVRARNAGGRP